MTKKLLLIALVFTSLNLLAQSPVLSNFRVDETNKNRVYFDSNESITASNANGFIINGKTITGISINSDLTTGHYLTISSEFNFWDNHTIRYLGGSNLRDANNNGLHDFALTYILNNISEPNLTGSVYYVNADVSSSGNGSSETQAFKTIQEALDIARAGEKVWIKAGDYGNENLQTTRSGTISQPIVFEGYKTTPGDITSVYYNYGDGDFDSTEMPLIDGGNRNRGVGLKIYGRYSNIILRNIQIQNYLLGVQQGSSESNNIILERILSQGHGSASEGDGVAFSLTAAPRGRFNYLNHNWRLLECLAINGTEGLFKVNGNYHLVQNCRGYADEYDRENPLKLSTDYYLEVHGDNNIVRESLLEKKVAGGHMGHAFGTRYGAEYNLFENNLAINLYWVFNAREAECQNNVWKNNESHADTPHRTTQASYSTGGFFINASNNVYENIYVHDVDQGIVFEGANNNILRNIVISNVKNVFRFKGQGGRTKPFNNNKFYNITVHKAEYMFQLVTDYANITFSGNEFKNSIFSNIGGMDSNISDKPSSGISYDRNNFFNNGFTPLGTNVLTEDPQFENENNGNFKLKSTSKLIDAGLILNDVAIDVDGIARPQGDAHDIGAFEFENNFTGSAGPDISICNGEIATLTASGGTSYIWSTGETTASILVSPTATETYTVTISDGTDSDTDDIIVTVDEAPSVDLGFDTEICSGETITLTATGVGNFLWSTGETTESITVSPSTTTTYEVLASNSCASDVSDEITVTVNPGVTLDAGPDISICTSETVTLTATSNGDFLWSTGETTASIEVSPAATTLYTVTSTLGGCTNTDEVEVIINELPSVAVGSDIEVCSGETVTLTATGEGDFLWSTGDTTESITVSPLATTTYTVTASNSCASDASDEVIVTVNPAVVLDAGSDVSICTGETVTLTATSNGDYLWSTGETTASINVNPIATTLYTVTSTLGGCTNTDEVQVTINELPSVNVGPDIELCSGEEVTLTATGEGDFLWSTGDTTESITVSPSATTTYTVTASNSCANDASDEVIVTVNQAVVIDAGSDVAICTGETVTLTATGNGDFLWSTGETTASIDVSPTTTHTFSVTSTLGSCVESDNVLVVVNQLPSVDLGPDVSICSSESIILTASGTGTFLWSTGETTSSITVNPSTTTAYSVVANNNTCVTEVSDEILVAVNPGVTLDAGPNVSMCSGETITLTATSNESVLWSTGETTPSINVSPTVTTMYTVSSGSGSCLKTDNVIVDVSQPPSVNLGSDVSICSGENIRLRATGTGSFLWSTGETTTSILVSPLATTTYNVTASNASCTSDMSDQITVTVNPEIILNVSSNVTICSGEAVTLSATSNGDFNWSTEATSSSIEVSPLTTTTYSVRSAIGDCFKTEDIVVTVIEPPVVDAGSDITICEGEEVVLTATGTGNFLWSTGETNASISVNPLETTTYTVTTINTGTCASSMTDSVTVNVNKAPLATANDDVVILSGSSVDLTVSGVGSFEWSTGDIGSRISVSPTVTTTYTVTASTGEGCSVYDEVVVTVVDEYEPTVITLTVGQDATICPGDTVVLEAPAGTRYLWNAGETESSIRVSPSITTIYSVKVYNGDNSETSHSTITVTENCSENITEVANDNFHLNQEMTVYPNPTKGLLNVKLKGYNNDSKVSVYNLNGTMMYTRTIDNKLRANVLREQLDLSKFPKGIYFVQLNNNGKSETKKVIVI